MKQQIVAFLAKHLKKDEREIENFLETPPDPAFGDYAFPCFVLAKESKKNPQILAGELKAKLNKKLPLEIDKIEAKGPYLNFFVNKEKSAQSILEKVLKAKAKFGSKKRKPKKILIEHTSINPNAPPHVGRARNALIGDALARLLKFQGNQVETHFYVNDISKQVAMLVHVFTGQEKFHDLLKRYVEVASQIEHDKQLEQQVRKLLEKFEQDDKDTRQKFRKVVSIAIEGQKKTFEELGISFDYFDYESDFLPESRNIIESLCKTGKVFKDEHGRQILNQEGFGFDEKMKSPMLVLTRSDGTGLYVLRDLAYTIWKMKKANRNILVLGEDQKLYFQQLQAALKLIGEKSPEVVHYSFVLIETPEGIEKMSTRRGDIVLLEDFMKDAEAKAIIEIKERNTKGDPKKIAIAAVKFAILKNDPNRNIIFNLAHALNFEGETGPYLLYSYARASSILRKARASKIQGKIVKQKETSVDEKEHRLISKIALLPELIQKAEQSLDISILANYAFQLAQIFNEFYHMCPVIGSPQEEFRLKLVEAFRHTIKNALSILGIDAIEEM